MKYNADLCSSAVALKEYVSALNQITGRFQITFTNKKHI